MQAGIILIFFPKKWSLGCSRMGRPTEDGPYSSLSCICSVSILASGNDGLAPSVACSLPPYASEHDRALSYKSYDNRCTPSCQSTSADTQNKEV